MRPVYLLRRSAFSNQNVGSSYRETDRGGERASKKIAAAYPARFRFLLGGAGIITDMVNSPLLDAKFRAVSTVSVEVLNHLRGERVNKALE